MESNWQDIVLMVVGFTFAPSLVASILKRSKYPLLTSIPTFVGLLVMVGVYITLDLYLAAISTGLTAFCWSLLVVIKIEGMEGKI